MFSGKGRFQNSEEMKEYEGGKWTVIQENSNLKNTGLKNAGLQKNWSQKFWFQKILASKKYLV